MKEQFVSYEIALKLKELGFDEPCLAYYSNKYGDIELFSEFTLDHSKTVFYNYSEYETIAPLFQQIIDWFRETHNIIVDWNLHDPDNSDTWRITISHYNCYYLLYNQNIGKEPYYKTYEEAREQAILKAIEIVKQNKL